MASATPEEGNLSMKHFRRCSMVLVLVVMPGAALSQASAPTAQEESPAVASHVQRAQEIAGSEWRFLSDGFLCGRAENTIPLAIRTIPGFLVPDAPAIEPFAAFDNLYYIGMYAWGTFTLDTGEGLILFDALTNERQVKEILLPGMAELGLDPEDLKYLVVTHGHVDHYGGAPYLKQEYGVPILMSEADWEYLPHEISLPYFVRANYPPVVQPERDQVVQDGEVLKLGNASVTFVITPGHTPGTLSTILTVKDQGEPRTVAMWGGQALPGDVRQLNQMHGSLHRFWSLGRERGVEGLISTHPWVVGNFELHARGTDDGSNPLLIGQDGFERVMGIYDECIKAQFARSLMRVQ